MGSQPPVHSNKMYSTVVNELSSHQMNRIQNDSDINLQRTLDLDTDSRSMSESYSFCKDPSSSSPSSSLGGAWSWTAAFGCILLTAFTRALTVLYSAFAEYIFYRMLSICASQRLLVDSLSPSSSRSSLGMTSNFMPRTRQQFKSLSRRENAY